MFACMQATKTRTLYQSDAFTLFNDAVVQGDNTAKVISETSIRSNYKSKESENYSRRIQFKFSLNKKDNELPSGKDHWLVVGKEHQSPILIFGQRDQEIPEEPEDRLSPNFAYTFRLDMRPVLKQFEAQGYYEAFDGSRVASSDFKGVYIAGGSEPMTWDFSNLDTNGLELTDPDGDGIYELELMLNPYDPADYKEKTWVLSEDVSSKPSYHSDQPIVDALFNLSLEEALLNIEADSTLRTGAKWGGVWTRDVSYSTLLAFAYHEPEVAKISLMKKVTPGKRIIQDTGSGGAYPVSSDRTTWALAAWEIYKVTGDQEWLENSYEILKNTLEDDAYNLASEMGLYRGESSFLDWREQTYPKWMDNRDIYVSQNLGTNVVHYQAHKILADMADILGASSSPYLQQAAQIKAAINKQLWMPEKGYYAQYLYGRNYLQQSQRFEALGEALAILFDVADASKAEAIISQSPVTAFGTTCIYPQIPGIPPYHNNGIWPFVQAYWNLAAAKTGNEEALLHGLAAIYRAGGLFLTNYENFVADNGDFMGTEINSHRMLWSMAGNLAMVHRVFMGMHFEPNGIRFAPVIPKAYGGTKSLNNFRYRNAIVDIKVSGFGNKLAEFYLDGEQQEAAFIAANLEGKHTIRMVMSNNDFSGKGINLVPNQFSLPNPLVRFENSAFIWESVKGAASYNVYKNGSLVENTTVNTWSINNDEVAEYAVSAVDTNGVESFISEPDLLTSDGAVQNYQLEASIQPSDRPYTNFEGKGFIETSKDLNTNLQFEINVQTAGGYLLDFRYSNGTGPWNTDNNCAIRTLYVNEQMIGAMIFPQRGKDEWSDWGFTNAYRVNLTKGNNKVVLKLEPWNVNMDGEINEAMLDFLRVIKL